MFRHPALVARDVRCDAQRQALLPKQRIPPVARTVGPYLAGLRKVHDVLSLIAGPGYVLLA